ncbi:MAG TPA: hypothetical protein VF546_09705 [Pyrinomonadaceae bacterium]|jgi:hypothetical protein
MRNSTSLQGDAQAAREFAASPFYAALVRALIRRGLPVAAVCTLDDPVTRRLLAEYGAMFLASDAVLVPPVCVFSNAEEVEAFQAQARPEAAEFGGVTVELQPAALDALLAARAEARTRGLDITPRGGAEAARRSYADTVRLWASRVEPALAHWLACGCLTETEVGRVRALAPEAQIAAVLELEERGLFCSKDFAKSILYSVAAPGASQHLALVAFDAVEFTNADVRATLARHGWFQTVRTDLPHFTFLGVPEEELPARGLRRTVEHGQTFWLPAVA